MWKKAKKLLITRPENEGKQAESRNESCLSLNLIAMNEVIIRLIVICLFHSALCINRVCNIYGRKQIGKYDR